MKFRKKPVVIEAVRIDKGLNENPPDWLAEAIKSGTVRLGGMHTLTRNEPWAEVQTMEGRVRGRRGDWIIRGVAGELYPCKAKIFQQTYEPLGG